MTKQEFDDASRAAAGEKAQGEKAQGFARISVGVELEMREGGLRAKFHGGPAEAGDKRDVGQLRAAAALAILAEKVHWLMTETFTSEWLAEAYKSALQELDRLARAAAAKEGAE